MRIIKNKSRRLLLTAFFLMSVTFIPSTIVFGDELTSEATVVVVKETTTTTSSTSPKIPEVTKETKPLPQTSSQLHWGLMFLGVLLVIMPIKRISQLSSSHKFP